MSREIKFRALFRHLATRKEVWFEVVPNYQLKDIEGYVQISDWEQYTGLKDKNGKEIYEGDILEMNDVDNHRIKICKEYQETTGTIKQLSFIEIYHRENKPSKPCNTIGRGYEIIGNMHQDKHLLK